MDDRLRHTFQYERQRGGLQPLLPAGVLVRDELTILETNTIEDVDALMRVEPLIQRGLRQFDLRPWELREGRMSITLTSGSRVEGPDII